MLVFRTSHNSGCISLHFYGSPDAFCGYFYRKMLPLYALVVYCLLTTFVMSSPDVGTSTDLAAIQRLTGEVVDGPNLHQYLRTAEDLCLVAGRSTAVCLSCEALAENVNAVTCCRLEPVYVQCQPIVESSLSSQRRNSRLLLARRTVRSFLGKRYRNRFLGKRAGQKEEDEEEEKKAEDREGEEEAEGGYDGRMKERKSEIGYHRQTRVKISSAGGRRPNNFLGKRLTSSVYDKRRNRFLGKREEQTDYGKDEWDAEEENGAAGNRVEKVGNAWNEWKPKKTSL